MLLPNSMNNCSILNNIAVADPSLGFSSCFLLFYVKILEEKEEAISFGLLWKEDSRLVEKLEVSEGRFEIQSQRFEFCRSRDFRAEITVIQCSQIY
jgi:hypothetical protein